MILAFCMGAECFVEHDFEILQSQSKLVDQKFTKMNMVLFPIITLVTQWVVIFVINFHNMQVSITGRSKMDHQVAEEDQLSAIVTMANVNGMIEKVKVKVKQSGLMETVVEKHSRGHPMT